MGGRIFVGMKTTVELPDDLIRAIKVRAAEEGRSVKDLLTELLRAALGRPPAKGKVRMLERDQMPIVKGGRKAKPSEEMTPERVARILWEGGE
jgi:plasmid stability protein